MSWLTNFSCKVETAIAQCYIAEVQNINRKLNQIMATQAEAAAQLQGISAELTKVAAETQTLLDNVKALQDAATAAGNVSPELQAAIDQVAAQAKTVDDLVPDAPAPAA
jgi:uncharacterized phage infection (PIP) family protein YhgE